MQGQITGTVGIAVLLDMAGGTQGTFEDPQGETSTITVAVTPTGMQISVEQDVWNPETDDWEGVPVEEPWEAFAQAHAITCLGTPQGPGRLVPGKEQR
jgi:hypothetical protein